MAALRGPGRYRAWAAPAVVAVLAAGGGWLATSGPASGHPSLPVLSPAQLLAKVATAKPPALSGIVAETSHLGLPSLPGADQSASLSWTSLITGSHTAKVWLDGPSRQRVAVLGTLTEAEIVHNGRDVWTYTSRLNQVSHTVLPAAGARGKRDTGDRTGIAAQTPIGVADMILKEVAPSTSVSVDPTQIVANHAAYTLVISPRVSGSTIRKVTVAIDGKYFVPLQVQVYGASATPALQIGFQKVQFVRPKASEFDFHAPAGATVVTNPLQARDHHWAAHRKTPLPHSTPMPMPIKHAAPKVIGSGWTAVVEFPNGLPAGAAGGVLGRLTTPAGSNGERLLTTALVNGVLLPDGRVFLGAVTPSLLEHVAATTPR